MKIKIFTLLAILLTLPAVALGQVHGTVFGQGGNGQLSMGVRNDSSATINPLDLGWGTFAVTASGQIETLVTDTAGNAQSVLPLTNSATGPNGTASLVVGTGLVTLDVIEAASTSQVLNLTAHVAVRGDVIRFPALATSPPTVRSWGVVCSTTANTVTLCDPLGFTPVAAQDISISRDIPIGAVGDSSTGSTSLNVNVTAPQGSAANGLLKLEDSAAASGDAGVAPLMKRKDAISANSDAADGDYVHPRTNPYDAQWVQLSASSYGGSLKGTIISAASTNAQVYSGGQSNLFGYVACNNTTTLKYIKLYDKNGVPSCGSDTVRHTIMVPKEGCVSATFAPGLDFASGIALCMVANMVVTDNTAIGANEVSFSYASR